jgi:hypothetical protein
VPLFEAYLRRHPELRTIIVTAFWSSAASGQNYREPLRIYPGSGAAGTRAAHKRISLQRALERLVRSFPERRFILLDDVPSGEVLSPRQIARQRYSRVSASGGLPRPLADSQRAAYEPVLRAVSADHPNVLYVPVLAALCGEIICPAADPAGRPLYQDGDHLSAHGSALVAPWLQKLFSGRPAP